MRIVFEILEHLMYSKLDKRKLTVFCVKKMEKYDHIYTKFDIFVFADL